MVVALTGMARSRRNWRNSILNTQVDRQVHNFKLMHSLQQQAALDNSPAAATTLQVRSVGNPPCSFSHHGVGLAPRREIAMQKVFSGMKKDARRALFRVQPLHPRGRRRSP